MMPIVGEKELFEALMLAWKELKAARAEVERLRDVLLHIECMKYSDADELREIARQALGDTHD